MCCEHTTMGKERAFRRRTGIGALVVLSLFMPLGSAADTYRLPLLPSASDALREGMVRIVNHSDCMLFLNATSATDVSRQALSIPAAITFRLRSCCSSHGALRRSSCKLNRKSTKKLGSVRKRRDRHERTRRIRSHPGVAAPGHARRCPLVGNFGAHRRGLRHQRQLPDSLRWELRTTTSAFS